MCSRAENYKNEKKVRSRPSKRHPNPPGWQFSAVPTQGDGLGCPPRRHWQSLRPPSRRPPPCPRHGIASGRRWWRWACAHRHTVQRHSPGMKHAGGVSPERAAQVSGGHPPWGGGGWKKKTQPTLLPHPCPQSNPLPAHRGCSGGGTGGFLVGFARSTV